MTLRLDQVDAVILDRDGVINVETGNYVKSICEWQFIEGSAQAIARLSQAGLRIFVATNQAGIAKGLYRTEDLEEIHQLMLGGVVEVGGKIEAIHYCPHRDEDCCDCRKPKSGLLRQIKIDHAVDLTRSIMVGDSLRDLQAAQPMGCDLVHVGPKKFSLPVEFTKPVPWFVDLASFVDYFLKEEQRS